MRFGAGDFRVGDHWLIPARTVRLVYGVSALAGTIEWPVDGTGAPVAQPPLGPAAPAQHARAGRSRGRRVDGRLGLPQALPAAHVARDDRPARRRRPGVAAGRRAPASGAGGRAQRRVARRRRDRRVPHHGRAPASRRRADHGRPGDAARRHGRGRAGRGALAARHQRRRHAHADRAAARRRGHRHGRDRPGQRAPQRRGGGRLRPARVRGDGRGRDRQRPGRARPPLRAPQHVAGAARRARDRVHRRRGARERHGDRGPAVAGGLRRRAGRTGREGARDATSPCCR